MSSEGGGGGGVLRDGAGADVDCRVQVIDKLC
jgi:hypothetical protein